MTQKNKKSRYIGLTFLAAAVLLLTLFFINKGLNPKSAEIDTNNSYNVSSDLLKNSDTDNDSNTNEDTDEDRFKNIDLTSKDIGVRVLYYHSVDANAGNEVTITPESLKKQLQYINDNNYTTITMKELYDYLNNNAPIPEKSIIITFDDGYMNNYTEAFPILKELNMKATIFCVGNSLDGSYYLSHEALKEMSDYGIDIESHTVNHVHLDTLSYDEQLSEMKNSKEILENITGREVISIAYPFGDYNADTIKATKQAGYSLGFTTNLGLAYRSSDEFELDRIYISSNYDMNTFKNLIDNTK